MAVSCYRKTQPPIVFSSIYACALIMSRENRQRRRRAINSPGHAHELTFSCYQRYPFMKADRCCQWLAEAIETARHKYEFSVWAFVIMPDHVHLIVHPHCKDYQMRRIMAGIKLPVSRRAIKYLIERDSDWLERLTRKRGQRTERLFWQSGGGYDRNIANGKTLLKMIDYLHLNPVRKGLVEQAKDWRWSSAAWFEGGTSPIRLDPIHWEWLDET